MQFEQAKKLRETSDEFDDFDDDFSDEEITEDEIAAVMSRPRNADDVSDTISMRSDLDDEDAASHHDKKASKLRTLMQTMDTFSRRAKNDHPKVRCTRKPSLRSHRLLEHHFWATV